jgi:hypothetical protein
VVEFYLQLRLILRIITYLTYICWEIDNFVIKSDIFRLMHRVKTHQLRHRHSYHVISFTNFVDLGLTGQQVLNRNILIYWSTGRHVLIHKFEVDLFQ